MHFPAPRIFAHLPDPQFGRPSQGVFGQSCVGPAGRNVAGSSRGDLVRNGPVAGGFKGLDHVQHRETGTGAQVKSQ